MSDCPARLLFGLLLLPLTACVGDAPPERIEPATIAGLLADNEPDHDEAGACEWEPTEASPLVLADDATAAVDGVEATPDAVTITAAGTWLVTGALSDRPLVIDTDGVVRLVLDGVSLQSADGPALRIEDAEQAIVVLAAGSDNVLSDGATHPDEQEAPKAALSSRADLTLCGDGALSVLGNHRDGISSSDGLVVIGGLIDIDAVDDGLRGKDYLVVRGGWVTVTAGGDGLVSDNEDDPDRGYVLIEDGELDVTSGGDGVSALTDLLVSGGALDVLSGGGASASLGEVSAKGLKAGENLVVEGGALRVDAADDAMHSDEALVFAGGAAVLTTGDDGVRGGWTVHVTGGELNIEESYEGLESVSVTISGGEVRIVASDDGVSVSDGTGEAGAEPAPGTVPGTEELCACALYIDGGRLVVTAAGDGLDSNGYGEITGGTVIVNGPEGDDGPPDAAMDFGELTISGGLLVSVHMDEMPDEIEGPSTQRYVQASLASSQSAGTLVHIEDAAGESLLTFAPATSFKAVVFSSPELGTGIHRLYVGGSADGEVEDGLYEGETYAAGDLEAEFSIASIATQVGESSASAQGGGPGRP